MIDAPGRPAPRFPPGKAPAAAARIEAVLDQLDAGPQDISFSQAAAGGDLLFLEACQARQVRCQVFLPFPEPEFIERSITPSAEGDSWRMRYQAMKARLDEGALRIMTVEIGPLADRMNPYERCNLWLLSTALSYGVEKVQFICLWNGGGGDGPGGTASMYDQVKRRNGRVTWIDTRTL